MGTGSSKRTAQVVAAGMKNNNHASENTNEEQHGESSHLNDLGNDASHIKGNVKTPGKTVADDTVQTKGENSVTQAVDQPLSSSSDSLLTSFSEKHPVIAATLSLTKDYYQGLKDALDSGNLLSPMTLGHVHGLFSVYLKYKKPKNRSPLTDFVVALGFPKIAYDVIVDCRNNYPELATWDRGKEKGKESEDEEAEKEHNNMEKGNDAEQNIVTEQNTVTEANVTEQNTATEGNDAEQNTAKEGNDAEQNTAEEGNVTEQNNVTGGNNTEQENVEKLNEKEQIIVDEGNEVSAIPENQEEKDDKEKKDALKMSQDIISQLLKAVLNYSDINDNFCLACDEAGMVPLLVEMIKELQNSIPDHVKYVNAETQQLSKYTVRGRMLSTTISILHNLSKRVPTRRSFAACQAINVLIPLLKAEVMIYSAKCLLVLAYLTDEENNHLIMADEGPIKFLTSLLRKSLRMVRHRYFGLSSAELAEGLTQIAVNDNNKKTIVQSGAIPVLVTMLQKAKNDDERLNACNTLWTLAFDEENRKEIKNNEFAIAELHKLVTTENSELRRAAAGALWECEGKEKYAEDKQLSVSAQEGVHVTTDTKHVMISYQWDVQKSIIQLKSQLQAQGYKVWMDIDEMGGSTLESMAKAVENACVVLVCVSQKYKESPNCRSEAEYTYQLHKDIIPLMMDYKYKPDGWLGMIVGTKFWIDFSERHKLDTNAEKLIKELGNRGKFVAQEIHQAATVDLVDASPQTSIRSWTNDDVKNWLKEVGLEDRLDPKAVKKLDGQMLLRLQCLRKESPEFFYSSIHVLVNQEPLDSVFAVLQFTDELDKLER